MKGGRFAELITEAEEPEGRDQSAGKGLLFNIRFEWREGEKLIGKVASYSGLLGSIIDEQGIQFVFEGVYAINRDHWVQDDWQVSIFTAPGHDNYTLWCRICDHSLRHLREGGAIKKIDVKRAHIVGRTQPKEPPAEG